MNGEDHLQSHVVYQKLRRLRVLAVLIAEEVVPGIFFQFMGHTSSHTTIGPFWRLLSTFGCRVFF